MEMRKALKIALMVVAAILLVLTTVLAYHGAFRSVVITESDEGPFLFVYREMRGVDMAEIGRITDDLNMQLASAGVSDMRPFDLFQPEDSASANEVGFVVAESDAARVGQMGAGVMVKTIPRQRYMLTTFPFKSRLSFVVGFFKVDPALRAYREQKGYRAALAISRNDGDTITYLQPVIQ
jgi:hypothetical protein